MTKKAAPKYVLPVRTAAGVNTKLQELGQVSALAEKLESQQAEIKNKIRDSKKEVAVVFIDMVGSTQFKIDNSNEPETWIRRVYLFSEIVTEYVKSLGGRVVKYIGDEVMAVFEGENCVTSICSLLARIEEIESSLKKIIGVTTELKIAADKGEAWFLEFEGHSEVDPQGTVVDRCARIAKFAKASTVLASFDLVKSCPKTFTWVEVSSVDLKGIGVTSIYQMGEKTIDISPTREIREDEYQSLKSDLTREIELRQKLELELARLGEMNEGLQQQIRDLAAEPDETNCVTTAAGEPDKWEEIREIIREMRQLIRDAPAYPSEYARFLFLDQRGMTQKYNRYERAFDKCIESKLVIGDKNGNFRLNDDNKRNQKARELMYELSEKLLAYDAPSDDLFDYSLEDVEFWKSKIGFSVQ